MLSRILLLLCSFLIPSFNTIAQTSYEAFMVDPNDQPREHPVDIQHMKVEVSFDTQEKLVKGKVTHTFTPLRKQVDSIFFDGPGINIKEASLDGKSLPFKTSSTGITVYPQPSLSWDNTYNISFVYEAHPKKGIYFIGWDDPKNLSRKQIWTQGQGIDNRHWIPMYDTPNDKYSTETIVSFDAQYQVLSNGTKLKESLSKDKKTKTWHYKMSHPHAGYLLMLGIGKYKIKSTKTERGVPVHFWYYPDHPEFVEPTSKYTEDMVRFLEDETGIPYPWESYSQIMVQDFLYGAMENTTATIFGDFFAVDERAFLDRDYIGVNCHELTHQWFGDYITARYPSGTWLQESFATYYGNLYYREAFGNDYYQWVRRQELKQVIPNEQKDKTPLRHSKANSTKVYPKGSQVIHMLRQVLGDEGYRRVLKHYLESHAYSNVETNDLYQAIQDKLGLNLDWFFDQWIYRGGLPHYEIEYEAIQDGTDGHQSTLIHVKQIHELTDAVKLFKMPITFEVHYTDGSYYRSTEIIDEAYEVVRLPNGNKQSIAYVLFDPGSHISKEVTFKRSFEELKAQLLKAEHMMDRYDALLALKAGGFSSEDLRDLYMLAYFKEPFFGIKAEMINQLGAQAATDEKVFELFRRAVTDPNPKVRMAVAKAVSKVDTKWLPLLEPLLQDQSYKTMELVLEKLCTQYPDKAAQYLETTKDIYGNGNSLRIKWLELACAIDKEQHIEELELLVTQSYEFRTRINAMDALKALNHLDETSLAGLFNAAVSLNRRLSGPAISTLKHFKEQTAYKPLIESYYRKTSWSDWERNKLSGLMK